MGKDPTLRGLPTWWVSSSLPPQAGRPPGGLFSACHMATSTLPCNHLPVGGLKWWEWALATSAACRGKGDTEVGPGVTVLGACLVLPTWTCRWAPSGCPTAPFSCSHLGSWTPCPSESTDPGQTARSCLRSSGSEGQRERGGACIEQALVKILENAPLVTGNTDLGMEGSHTPVCVCVCLCACVRTHVSVCVHVCVCGSTCSCTLCSVVHIHVSTCVLALLCI